MSSRASDQEGKRADADSPALIGVDVGTQSVRAIAFDVRGRRIAAASRPTPFRISETGGEFDPDAIFATALSALTEVGSALADRPVAGIAAASVGESCVILDESGRSLAPSIVWHDRRTHAEGLAIEQAIRRDRIFEISGHSAEPIFTLAKLIWMRKHWPEAFAKARRVLMMADWIAFRLSGEAATDPTLASRTLYFDIRQRRWSEEMLAFAGLPLRFPAPLANIGAPIGTVGREILAETGLQGTPIVAVGGHDHIIGALATGLSEPASAINSIGTAEALLLATDKPLADPDALRKGYVQGALATDSQRSYVAGALLSSGGSIEWLRSIAGSVPQETLIAEASKLPPGSGGVLFLPLLANGPPPNPDVYARGAFFGLTQVTTPAQMYRAVLEGLALQSRMMLDGMTALPGVGGAKTIRFIGGTSRNRLFLSIKASAFGRPMLVVEEPEATALGAAMFAGVAAGLYPSFDAAFRSLDRKEYVVEPDSAAAEAYDRLRMSVFAEIHDPLKVINRGLSEFSG
jgi:xylulokinase